LHVEAVSKALLRVFEGEYGDVAQLVEHLLCKQEVAGSSPAVSTGSFQAVTRRIDHAQNERGRPWMQAARSQIIVEVREQPNERMELPSEHTAPHRFELAGVPQRGRPFGPGGLGEDSACHRLELARVPQHVAVGTDALC
jgi:hypothetical protein